MERNDDSKSKPNRRRGEKPGNEAPFTIVGAGAKRAPQGNETPPPKRKQAASPSKKPESRTAFRDLATRRKGDSAPKIGDTTFAERPFTEADEREAAKSRRARILRLWPRLLRRGVYRFHARFSLAQILAFYVGIPALLSVAACVYVLMLPAPKAEIVKVSRPPASAATLLNAVVAALRDKDNAVAGKAVERLTAAYPDDARSHIANGAFLSTLGKNDEARAAMLRALELSPNNPSATMNLAELEFSAGRYEQAIEYYSKLPNNTANTALVAFRLYICYEKTGRSDEAQALIRAGRFRSQSAEDFFIRAAEASRRGDEAEARRLVSSAELLFGEKAKAYQTSLKKMGWLK